MGRLYYPFPEGKLWTVFSQQYLCHSGFLSDSIGGFTDAGVYSGAICWKSFEFPVLLFPDRHDVAASSGVAVAK